MTEFKFESEAGNRYGLVWKDHPEEVFEKCKTEIPTLKMINGRNIWAVDAVKQTGVFDNYHTRPHILIEGDNYHALKVLEFTHAGKIDVIYIDPPYNTGNKDFMYNDKFIDKEDCYRHSKWLSFMYKRLLLARELLSDTGSIFVQIGGDEFAQLKLLMDKVFGEENFINSIIWSYKTGGIPEKLGFSRKHDYILSYGKNVNNTKSIPLYQKSYTPTVPEPHTQSGKNLNVKRDELCDICGNSPGQKYRLVRMRDVWNDVNALFRNNIETVGFNTQKPIKLIKRILKATTDENSTVLDFFAGSGTTGIATLELNKEDGGNRQFILCTNNENNICTEVCYPRLKKVIEGYKTPNGKMVEGIPANLVYFTCGRNKIGSSAFMPIIGNSDPDVLKLEIAQHSTGIIKTIENTYIEKSKRLVENTEELEYMILRNGGKKEHGNKYVAIYYTIYDENLKELRDKMNAIREKDIEKVLYYFTLNDELYAEDFKDWNNTLIKMFPKDFFNKFLNIAKRGIEYHYI